MTEGTAFAEETERMKEFNRRVALSNKLLTIMLRRHSEQYRKIAIALEQELQIVADRYGDGNDR